MRYCVLRPVNHSVAMRSLLSSCQTRTRRCSSGVSLLKYAEASWELSERVNISAAVSTGSALVDVEEDDHGDVEEDDHGESVDVDEDDEALLDVDDQEEDELGHPWSVKVARKEDTIPTTVSFNRGADSVDTDTELDADDVDEDVAELLLIVDVCSFDSEEDVEVSGGVLSRVKLAQGAPAPPVSALKF
ncbi:hypothetical protein G6O67_004491 [Ophiocordyceps sinensis]|uniref:Uncharacterized protein n=1 Tax=Ophiocordyceps sinensis TaxID=72228 RepID=A0A8H4PPJ5_9HYPO|nr:hypothetical protein G6O67_004491 [Ophiocordyceps sinensis]